MRTLIPIRLPEEIAERPDSVVREIGRPRSSIVQMALELYLEDIGDAQVALDRLRDASDAVVSGVDMREGLGA